MTVRQIEAGTHRTVVAVLREAAEINAEVEAYVEPAVSSGAAGPAGAPPARRSLTFSQWDRAADGLAGLLAARGVRRGDVVCLLLPSSIDYAVCYAAALRLGAVTSGVNPRLGRAEVASVVGRSRPVLTVVDPALGVALPPGAGAVVTRAEAAAAVDGPPPARFPALHEDDPVAVVWTSGTTGRPKGAVFDHRCLAAVSVGADVLSRPGDRRLSPLPFAHVGYMTKVWDEIAHGITTVITPTPWRAADALAIMEEERITVAQGVPTQWALVLALDELDRADLSSLRIAGTGAAPMPAVQVAEVRRRLGVPVVVRYASTETAICTGTVPEDPDEVVATTVGRPVSGVALSVVGEDGREVGPGQPGRVRIRSRAVLRGYWGDRGPGDGLSPGAGEADDRGPDDAAPGGPVPRGPSPGSATPGDPSPRGEPPRGTAHLIDPEATARVLSEDGWVTTGDFGIVGEDGNLRLVGREHERYIRGGYNVYPVEVEEVLAAHPAVARAAVVGAPDPVLGEVGVAFVVPSAGAAVPDAAGPVDGGSAPAERPADGRPDAVPPLAELRAWCAGQLADYKAPDALVVLDALPLTPMMKVDKRSLAAPARDAAAAHLAARGSTRPPGGGVPGRGVPAGGRGPGASGAPAEPDAAARSSA